MSDLVGTCPKWFWEDWLAEGGLPEEGDTGTWTEWGWGTSSRLAAKIGPGDRFYVVAHGKLRGYAPVLRVEAVEGEEKAWEIIRRLDAVACTIQQPIPGFRGLRMRWWERAAEIPFPEWKRP